jgi:hypothetical protein
VVISSLHSAKFLGKSRTDRTDLNQSIELTWQRAFGSQEESADYGNDGGGHQMAGGGSAAIAGPVVVIIVMS